MLSFFRSCLEHLGRRLKSELIVWDLAGVHPCVNSFNIHTSEIPAPITIKFYMKNHWGREKAAIDFGLDRIRILGSMAIHSHTSVKMGETSCLHLLDCFLSDTGDTCG